MADYDKGDKKAIVSEIQSAVKKEAQKRAKDRLDRSDVALLYIKVHIKF